MTKGQKALVWTLSIAVGGVATYFIYKALKCKINPAKCTPEGEETLLDSAIEKTKEVVTGESYASTPFKSKAEGDAFRAWINDTYPDYAREIDLDRAGKFNNSYIKKAFAKYGEQYLALSRKPKAFGLVDIQTNLGNNYIADVSKPDRIYVKSKIRDRFKTVFFNNGRVHLNDEGSSSDPSRLYAPIKGNWYEGGKKIKIDGGGTYLNSSVIKNLSDIVSAEKTYR